jgi:acyl-CoA dehydrogenase
MKTAREIIQTLPERFIEHKVSDDLDIIFHFEIAGSEGGDFTVQIKNRECTIEEGLHGTPKCVVTTKDKVYTELEYGKTNQQMAFMMGKIKVSNLGAMFKFMECFEKLY